LIALFELTRFLLSLCCVNKLWQRKGYNMEIGSSKHAAHQQ
jgi:hypothetical protein